MNWSTKYQAVLICLSLTIATIVVYGQVRKFEFATYDDTTYVSQNINIQQGFTPESIKWAFTTDYAANWHPLTWLSHMLDYRLFGLDSGMHHLINVFFHIFNTLLLFAVFRKMTGNLWQSAFVAALFALHPLHVESVAWVSERKDVLSTFFWILAMGAYAGYAARPSGLRYAAVCLLLSLGLMSKPMVVTLPCVLLLLDVWPLKRMSFDTASGQHQKDQPGALKLVVEKLPLFVLVVISCAVTYYAQQHGGAVKDLDYFPMGDRIANAIVVYVLYIINMIIPTKLACLYPHPGMLPGWQVIFSGLFLLSVTAMVLKLAKSRPYLPVGWFWYLGTLVPVIGLVQVGSQAMADRYTYIPLIGLFVMVAWGVPEILKTWRSRNLFLWVLSVITLIILTGLTWHQVGYWKDSTTLFEHAVAVTDNNYTMQYNLGNVLAKKGQAKEAMAHFLKAIEMKPNMVDAHNNLANVYTELGKTDLAVAQYLEILAMDPGYAGAQLNLAIALDSQGKTKEAIPHFLVAIKAMPDNANAFFKAANAQFQTGDIDGAITHYRQAIRIQPDFVNARCNLGVALFRKGDVDGAVSEFKAVLWLRPGYPPAKLYLEKALSRISHEEN